MNGSIETDVRGSATIPRVRSIGTARRSIPADTITLDSTARHRRRTVMTSDNGIEFLLDLPEARLLRDGEGLELEDGRVIAVRAAAEPLTCVRGRDAAHLLQLAWQIGNRHLEAQIFEDRLLIRRDPVIRDMLVGLGADVEDIEAPFDPEGGAYGQRHERQHGHSPPQAHGHDHDHHRGNDHGHDHANDHG